MSFLEGSVRVILLLNLEYDKSFRLGLLRAYSLFSWYDCILSIAGSFDCNTSDDVWMFVWIPFFRTFMFCQMFCAVLFGLVRSNNFNERITHTFKHLQMNWYQTHSNILHMCPYVHICAHVHIQACLNVLAWYAKLSALLSIAPVRPCITFLKAS